MQGGGLVAESPSGPSITTSPTEQDTTSSDGPAEVVDRPRIMVQTQAHTIALGQDDLILLSLVLVLASGAVVTAAEVFNT